MYNKDAEAALNNAYIEAQNRGDMYLTPEHLLWGILNVEEGAVILMHAGTDITQLRSDIQEYLSSISAEISTGAAGQIEIIQTPAFQRIMESAIMHVQRSQKKELDIGDLLSALYGEEDIFALYFLQKQGVERIDILNYVSHGISKPEGDFSLDSDIGDFGEDPEDADEFDDRSSKALQTFCENMTDKAKQGQYDKLVGREHELMRTIEILCRRQKNNPIHLGDPGVGKTAITCGLAQRIADGNVPPRLADYEIYSLNLGAMLAGSRYRGDFEARLNGVIKDLEGKKAILFIDEIHTIVGAGQVQGNSMDAANILKPILSNGNLRCIGSTTHEEYRQHFEKDRALARRFQKIDINEPTVEETIEILSGLKERYENYHKVEYSSPIIKLIAELSSQYINDRFLPDKAIDVLDEAGANLSVYHPDRKKITETDITNLIARIARVPVSTFSAKEKIDLLNLELKLQEFVFGQDKAIHSLVSSIKRHRAGLGHPEKPVGSFLFIGPTGVGKTELSRRLAAEMGIPLLRFDMSEYMEKHSISRLLGSPPGYVGFDQGAQLTDSIRRNPRCVLLLDEIEKAHPDIYNSLLQVMDHASLTDATGRTADFRNVILIMTSNAGAREMSANKIGFFGESEIKGDPKKAIKSVFTPEFINRLDDIVTFANLSRETIMKIVRKFVLETESQLTERKIILTISPEAMEYLATKGYDQTFGARPMARLIQEKIKDAVVEEILSGKLEHGGTVVVGIQKGEIKIQAKSSRKRKPIPKDLAT